MVSTFCRISIPHLPLLGAFMFYLSSLCVLQLCGCGQGCRSSLSLFPILSLPGASQAQQQSRPRFFTLSLFFSCLIVSGVDRRLFVPSSVRWLHQMSNTPRSMTWFSTATSKRESPLITHSYHLPNGFLLSDVLSL